MPPRFLHVTILRRPDFFFFQTAMEPFNVAVPLGVMIRRPSMPNSQPVQCFNKARRSELRSIVGGQNRASTACSTASRASSVRQRCDRFQLTISLCSSRSHSPGTPSPLLVLPRSWSCPTARSDWAQLLPPDPTLSSFVLVDLASVPAVHALA
jgi:hypothetical protein